jgi:hypothetical protein
MTLAPDSPRAPSRQRRLPCLCKIPARSPLSPMQAAGEVASCASVSLRFAPSAPAGPQCSESGPVTSTPPRRVSRCPSEAMGGELESLGGYAGNRSSLRGVVGALGEWRAPPRCGTVSLSSRNAVAVPPGYGRPGGRCRLGARGSALRSSADCRSPRSGRPAVDRSSAAVGHAYLLHDGRGHRAVTQSARFVLVENLRSSEQSTGDSGWAPELRKAVASLLWCRS